MRQGVLGRRATCVSPEGASRSGGAACSHSALRSPAEQARAASLPPSPARQPSVPPQLDGWAAGHRSVGPAPGENLVLSLLVQGPVHLPGASGAAGQDPQRPGGGPEQRQEPVLGLRRVRVAGPASGRRWARGPSWPPAPTLHPSARTPPLRPSPDGASSPGSATEGVASVVSLVTQLPSDPCPLPTSPWTGPQPPPPLQRVAPRSLRGAGATPCRVPSTQGSSWRRVCTQHTC